MKSTTESLATLIDTCLACAEICHANGIKCKEMKGMEDCYHICINCSEECKKVIAEFKARSEYLLSTVDKCAHISKQCAMECAKHDNNHCRECAEICLKCTETCSTILGQENKPVGAF